jgi:lipopolysaccharide heptosyltransferase I
LVLVRLSALGDIIHTWPLAEALRSALPDLHLTWVVEQPFRTMVDGHPSVDGVITVATKRWRRRPLAARTRLEVALVKDSFLKLQPEIAVDPQGVLKSALITRWSGAPQRFGLARRWRRERIAGLAYTRTVAGSSRHRHVVASNLELVRAVGATPPPDIPAPDGSWLLDRLAGVPSPIPHERPYAVLLPGAGQTRKLLPVSTLSEIARRIAALGLEPVVVWGPGEQDRATAVVAAAGDRVTNAPPTDLEQLTVLLAGARIVIGGDTGPVHLAASLGVATVGVFTATDWRRNGPLGPRVAVVSGVAFPDRGPARSSRAISARLVTANEVATTAERLLGGSGQPLNPEGP